MARERTQIEIQVIDGATRALNSIAESTAAGTTKFTELNSVIGLVGKAFDAISAGADFAADLLQPARDAETAMQMVAVATNATTEELELLRAKSNDVAFALRVPFDQVAAGAAQLARDGANATQVLENIAPVTAFAKSALLTTAEAAGQLSDILDGYGEGIGNIGAIGDVIIATARSAGVGADELTEGIKKIGPAATAAGLGVNEVAALLGTLAQNGVGGAKAVKGLETVLFELNDPASKAGESIRNLGLDTNDLPAIFQRLSTDATAASTVLAAFSDKPRLSLKLLLADGGGALKELTGIINESAGASEQSAEKLGSTFDGAVTRIGIALDALKTAFFTPLLEPFANEIDVISDKIKAFTETKDFDLLRTAIGDFAIKAIAELNRIGAEFDAAKAIAAIKKFVADAGEALGGLKTTVDTLKTGFAAVGVAFNSVQTGAAAVVSVTASAAAGLQDLANKTGLAGDEGERYSEILHGVADSAADSAAANDRERQSYEDLLDPANAAANSVRGVAAGQLESAGAASKNAAAHDDVARVLPQVTELSQGLRVALNQTAQASVKAGDGIFDAVKRPSSSIDALRVKIKGLNQDLTKAFAEGADTKQIIKDLNAAEAELQRLTEAAKPAGEAVKKVGDEAQTAAPKVQSLANSSGKAAEKAKELADSTDSTAGSLLNLTGAGQAAVTIIEGVSEKFAQLQHQQQQSGAVGDQLIAENLRRGLESQREQVGLALKSLDDYDAAVENRLKQLRSKYDLLDDEILRKLAEKQAAADKASAQRQADTPPSVRSGGGASPSGIGGGAPVFNITLQSLNPGDLSNATVSDLARRLVKPIQQIILSGA